MKILKLHFVRYLILVTIGILSTYFPSMAHATWHRISTPHFEILFPIVLVREAHRVANSLEYLYQPVSQTLAVSPKRITVILRNQTTSSNGFFTMMPRRMEFFTFPMHDYNFLHNNDWMHVLMIHEFRHVVQGSILNQRFNKFLYVLGGEALPTFWNNLNIPKWFYEGDAVGIETALTHGGRGRIPYFGVLYKANLLEKGGFGYQKQLFGSFNNKIPDHYKLGYYLTTYLRRHYGTHVLADIFKATTYPMLFPLAVKTVTGKSLLKIYQDTNRELKELWTRQLQDLNITPVQRVNTRSNKPVYTDYQHPQIWKEQIIALKKGMDATFQFVLFNQQKQEKRLFKTGKIKQETGFSLVKDKMVWVEHVPDFFQEDCLYSVIQLYDFNNQKRKKLTSKSRYGSAMLSPDASKIVALESDPAYNHQLVILDSDSGQVLHRIPNPNNDYYFNPRFSPDGTSIITIKHINQQATISLIHIATGYIQDLLPPTQDNIGWPVMAGNHIFYNSDYSGIDNIYALDLATKQIYQVTSRKYGAYHACIDIQQKIILFNDFTKDGMDVVQVDLNPQQWIPIEKVAVRKVNYYAPLLEQETSPAFWGPIPQHTYPIQPYRTAHHPFLIHSWTPYFQFSMLNGASNLAGLAIHSQNVLNTISWFTYYEYYFTGKFGQFFTELFYKGWYPKVKIGGYLNKINQSIYVNTDFPLTWQKGAYHHQIHFEVNGNLYQEMEEMNYKQTYKICLSRTSVSTPRAIKPPWLQKLRLVYEHVPYSETNQEKMRHTWHIKSEANVPGIFKNHILSLKANYVYKRIQNPGPTHLHNVSVDSAPLIEHILYTYAYYTFPICYPDWEVGLLSYIKRLSNELFYEGIYPIYQTGNRKPFKHAFGTELTLELHLLTLPETFKLGIRYAYQTNLEKHSLESIFNNTPIWSIVFSYGLPRSKSHSKKYS